MAIGKISTNGWDIPKREVVEFHKKRTHYCVCVPIINEGKKITKQLAKMKKYSGLADIVLFDGGSTDGSTKHSYLRKQGVRALVVSPSGQSVQLRAGLSWVLEQGYEGVVTIDGNGKDDISAIPKFLKALDAGYGYVQGSRWLKGGHHANTPSDRVWIARLFISPILSIAGGKWHTDTPNAFRAYSREFLLDRRVQPFRKIFKRYEHLWYFTVRANQLGYKTTEIPVTRVYPRGKVPTKIVGWKRIGDVVNILKVVGGLYNP